MTIKQLSKEIHQGYINWSKKCYKKPLGTPFKLLSKTSQIPYREVAKYILSKYSIKKI